MGEEKKEKEEEEKEEGGGGRKEVEGGKGICMETLAPVVMARWDVLYYCMIYVEAALGKLLGAWASERLIT